MAILLTGSTGFIGENILRYFSIPDTLLIAPTRSKLDLRDTHKVNEYINENKPEMIIHCGSNDHDICLYDNLKMFTNLAQTGIPMITFCTGREIEDRAYKNGEYVLSKRIIKELSLNLYNHITVIQLWGCFGANEKDIRFFKSNMNNILEGNDIVVGEDKMFSYVYVKDIVKLISTIVPGQEPRLLRPVAYTYFLSTFGGVLKDAVGADVNIHVKKEAFCNSYVGKNNVDMEYTPLQTALKEMYAQCII